MTTIIDAATRQRLIDEAVRQGHPDNHQWMREYFTRYFDSLLAAVRGGQPLRHGFRGLDFRDAMDRLGIK